MAKKASSKKRKAVKPEHRDGIHVWRSLVNLDWRWHVYENGNVTASGEGHKTKDHALRAIKAVRERLINTWRYIDDSTGKVHDLYPTKP